MIRILPDFVANQIAAGEVVQRPESVVKELIENSLDAGADSLVVVVRDAGKQLIHIVDNGSGMSREDLSLSIKRHATSKIISSEDLESIMTFGFRGEALASIASVANIEMRTRRNEDNIGSKLISEPLKEVRMEPVNTDAGTQVFVRNLFYNVPARRKFLKSNLTEFRYISETMIKFALSKPSVRFVFYDGDTLIFDLKPAKPIQRISELLGLEIADSLMPLSSVDASIKIEGFAGMPQVAKKSASGQYLFLNGRPIKSKSLNFAVTNAYEHILEKTFFPVFIINIIADPHIVDVNVHPQKHEVKFEDERLVFNLINHAVSDALRDRKILPAGDILLQQSSTPFIKAGSKDDLLLVNKVTGEIIDHNLAAEKSFPNRFQGSGSNYYKNDDLFIRQKVDFTRKDLYSPMEKSSAGSFSQQEKIESRESPPESMFWQLHKKYICMQNEKGMIIFDQHAAHERVLYEKALQAMNREFSYSQNLLFSMAVKLNTADLSLISEIKNELESLGYGIRMEGQDSVILDSVPSDINSGEEESSFREILTLFEEYQKNRASDKRDNLAASYSCKAAIKTGYKLSQDEMKRLWESLMKCDVPFVCPHGRPVFLEFSIQDLDKRFCRI